MAAARSQLHLGSPPRKASYGPRAPTPQPLVLCNRIPGQPLHQDGRTLVPLAQAVPLQVDMAMALQRVRISENYETDLLLRVKDISHFLMQDIAFLSGGRGKDNASIITFPENCNFRYIPEDVIAKVLTYLMSVARQNGSDSRFTLIVDRRLDTWFSLKISLQKISVKYQCILQ
ncbi:putative Guanine Nucleotide Exchange Factor Mcf2L2 [Manis pentadactyla]|nr:putative Guanine Nucleotide Exchange Factor Mcf2L2 [Manis pentadactyla]